MNYDVWCLSFSLAFVYSLGTVDIQKTLLLGMELDDIRLDDEANCETPYLMQKPTSQSRAVPGDHPLLTRTVLNSPTGFDQSLKSQEAERIPERGRKYEPAFDRNVELGT